MSDKYEKIISIPRPKLSGRKKMSLTDRAAQFAPFAALVGFEESVKEQARVTERKIIPDEYETERLDRLLREASQRLGVGIYSITFFLPDKRKSGGAYVTVLGTVARIDEYGREVIMSEGERIPIDEIINIEEIG